jgi:hypothetical protein
MILTGKTEEHGEKPVPVPLCPLQDTTDEPAANPGLRGEKPATNSFSHYSAYSQKLFPTILTH